MTSVVEDQITELCRDVAVEVKRMQRLQMQTDDLRLAIEEWVDPAASHADIDIKA